MEASDRAATAFLEACRPWDSDNLINEVRKGLTAAAPHLASVRVNVDEIVQPLEDINAPGGLCRWTDVATAIGEVRRALSALEPPAGRAAVLEEAARAAEAMDEIYDSKVGSYAAAAIRALSSPDHAAAGKVEGDGWLPIESAPKDGTEIIYLTKYGSIGFCRYDPAINEDDDDCWWDAQADDEVYPKFWLPRSVLPSAPASEGAE